MNTYFSSQHSLTSCGYQAPLSSCYNDASFRCLQPTRGPSSSLQGRTCASPECISYPSGPTGTRCSGVDGVPQNERVNESAGPESGSTNSTPTPGEDEDMFWVCCGGKGNPESCPNSLLSTFLLGLYEQCYEGCAHRRCSNCPLMVRRKVE